MSSTTPKLFRVILPVSDAVRSDSAVRAFGPHLCARPTRVRSLPSHSPTPFAPARRAQVGLAAETPSEPICRVLAPFLDEGC